MSFNLDISNIILYIYCTTYFIYQLFQKYNEMLHIYMEII